MKIGILGTRGIPNHYGGFEQFAEYVSQGLVELGHEVSVYCSSNHDYKEPYWNRVNLIHRFDPENIIGTVGQFIYDLNCIVDSRYRKFDVILQLGYTSSSIWGFLLPKSSVIITNMDGLEWKRSKFSSRIQSFLKYAEKLAIRSSDLLIADSIGIKEYLFREHNVDSIYIPYGAEIPLNFDLRYLAEYGLEKRKYNMLVARLEPENNIEMILDGACNIESENTEFVVIGNHNTKYGKYLREKYSNGNVRFLGGVYDLQCLNAIRNYSKLYFHGHSVGGTNPSLLEAMASGALICAHNNIFNKSILEEHAYYFSNSKEVQKLLNTLDFVKREAYTRINQSKITNIYSWDRIINSYNEHIVGSIQLSSC